MDAQGLVTVNDVDIRYIGVRQKSYFGGRSSLSTTIVHEGTPTVRARNCTDYQFVHDRTTVLHAYDISSGKTTQPATFFIIGEIPNYPTETHARFTCRVDCVVLYSCEPKSWLTPVCR